MREGWERGQARSETEAEVLSELGAAFHAFRASAPGVRPRVPQGLRERVLRALQEGCPAAELYRVCGVTRAQVTQWAKSSAAADRPSEPVRPARVLRVVEGESKGSRRVERSGVQFELRIGPWRMQVQRAGG
jgi:hypothetical protein